MPDTFALNDKLTTQIHELGKLLGEVLIEQEGIEIYNYVEELRRLTKDFRAGTGADSIPLITDCVNKLSVEQAAKIVKAFSIYFILVNAADEINKIRAIHQRLATANDSYKGTFSNTFKELKTKGLSDEAISGLLNSIEITPVFTAHPTEATRQTVLRKIRKICELLQDRDVYYTNQFRLDSINRKLKAEITLLWQTNDVRFRKIAIEDEVQRGLFLFKDILYNAVPNIYEHLEYAKKNAGLHFSTDNVLINFGSWIGSDRDGHPFVTSEVTKQTMIKQKEQILQLYRKDIERLYAELSPSVFQTGVSAELEESVSRDKEKIDISIGNHFIDPSEFYRYKLSLIFAKLLRASENREGGYAAKEELISDLLLISDSLHQNKGGIIAQTLIKPLIEKVKTFGFNLARLDIRQNAALLRRTVAEAIENADITANFEQLSEDEKIEILSNELLSSRPVFNGFKKYSPEAEQVLSEFSLIVWAQQHISTDAGREYIISNCSRVSDILGALLLAKESGLVSIDKKEVVKSDIDILPLFETISDLRGAAETLNNLYSIEAYRMHLSRRNNIQKIMIGYSDSNKDGGITASNFELYKAQISITDISAASGLNILFFHGRGGSISRGGGPVFDSILSIPQGTMTGKIKITEQGEMVSAKYLTPEIANENLELMISAVILSAASQFSNQRQTGDYQKYFTLMSQISELSMIAYRALINAEGFQQYFREATPIDIIEQLEIGSRPSARKQGGRISDLRAIPWVFSWTQNRQTISGWFGFGSAIQLMLKSSKISIDELRSMYRDWNFFKVLVDNIEMVLFKTDMMIGREYASLYDGPGNFFNIIKNEYDSVVTAVLNITGETSLLDNNPALQRTLALRNPYIDPISFVQLRFIKEYRKQNLKQGAMDKEITSLLRSTVNGIAAGIRNTG